MSFDPNARLDPSQVQDVGRGRGRGVAIGGGGLGLTGIVIYLLISLLGGGGTTGDLGDLVNQSIGVQSPTGTGTTLTECRTGADANRSQSCRAVGYVNSVQAYWRRGSTTLGRSYEPAVTIFFQDQVSTACGDATTAVGPFYCPADKHVYIDLGFFQELHDRFGATAGSFAQGYVIAHEYGHHVQDLLGYLSRIGNDRTGPQSAAVRSELQADCYAGMWAKNAVSTGYLQPLTKANVDDALNAAASVGDDRIQSATSGRVDQESFTHGSAAQRQNWFKRGLTQGTLEACDTWSGAV
jgi:predicted metalloprotease